MTIKQLIYVVEVAKSHSFNKASEALYISEPSLSVSIKKLEEELGEPLFIRRSNGVTLTHFGAELLPFIQEIISLYDQMPLQYGSTDNMPRLCVANGGFRFFSEAAGNLYEKYKKNGILIDFHDVTVEQSLKMVTEGKAQLGGFMMWDFQRKSLELRLKRAGVTFVPLGTAHPTVTVGPKNPLWNREEDWVTLDMVRSYPIIYSFTEHSNALLRQLGLYNRLNLITCRERGGRGELAMHTDGISVGAYPSDIYKKALGYSTRRTFRLEGYDFVSEFGYIYNSAYALSSIAREYIDCLLSLTGGEK